MDKEEFKTVATFTEKVMADLTVAMLRDNGIPAAVFGYNSAYPSFGYAHALEVKVNEADYEAAKKLLESSTETGAPEE